jgi:hypothetical protein
MLVLFLSRRFAVLGNDLFAIGEQKDAGTACYFFMTIL